MSTPISTEQDSSYSTEHKNAPFFEKHPKGFGEMKLLEEVKIERTYVLPVPHLADAMPQMDRQASNRRKIDTQATDVVERKDTYNKIMGQTDVILGDIRRNGSQEAVSRAYVRAGPRATLFFDPTQVKAAIVTCGGLCPGLNNVIRDITLSLWNLYGVHEIYGIRMGFEGFYNWTSMDQKEAPIMLTPQVVETIHHSGGTILGANRGGFDMEKIISFLTTRQVNQLYVIGGDGTHRAANKIADECRRRKLPIAVAGVPKTIDNDVDLLDRSFGFNTAVEEAQRAIRSAKTEAKCVPNGIGIVKLMGRSAGFIAAHATLSSGDVNLCLVPEVPIELHGPRSCLDHLERVIEEKGHGVVVVAEGAGEELLGTSSIVDAGGNKKLPPIGEFMKHQIQDHFKKKGKDVTVKYIDPSYMIRSVPANAGRQSVLHDPRAERRARRHGGLHRLHSRSQREPRGLLPDHGDHAELAALHGLARPHVGARAVSDATARTRCRTTRSPRPAAESSATDLLLRSASRALP
ncbi:hypothetical protein PINS_up020769 [Pythium insidiosum]|nr:hypothetical protein PINS_up020769 [Pythium insidiosum]